MTVDGADGGPAPSRSISNETTMSKRLPVPTDLQFLIEKREQDERRQSERRKNSESAKSSAERRKSTNRRQKRRRKRA
jgi:hypothetical protein